MSQVTLRERFRYRIDTFLSRGSKALFLALSLAFVGSIASLFAFRLGLSYAAGDVETPLWRHVWLVFLQLTDPGNMSQDNDTRQLYKLQTVMAGFTGVVIFSSLIAFLNTALNDAIEHLKKGHGPVIEEEHTLVLGWGPRVVEILEELAEAKDSEYDPVVTILSSETKADMDEHLRVELPDLGGLRVVTRHGSTASIQSLRQVNVEQATSAIVLALCDGAATQDQKLASDAHVVKSVLAIVSQITEKIELSIVAELFDPRNRAVVEDLARGRIVTLDAEEILAKIMVQTSRTTGLAVVYSELLSFKGCEIYFHKAPWGGVTFGDALYRFADGVPIGLRRAGGVIAMRPPGSTPLVDTDDIIIVAQDDSSVAFQKAPVLVPAALTHASRTIPRRRERMLILGWSPKAEVVLREYSSYVLEGSSVDVVLPAAPPRALDAIEALRGAAASVALRYIDKNPLSLDELASLDPFSYDTVLIFRQNPDAEASAERVDSESIMVLLHLRRLKRELGRAVTTKIITEVLDSANQDLINRAGVDDFIISDRLVSMLFAQLSEEAGLKAVYDDLFEEEGSEIYVKPAGLYFTQFPVEVRFGDLLRVAQTRGDEVCIGFKLKALEGDSTRNYGVSLVPPKNTVVTLTEHDALVVVAADDR